MKVLAVGPWIVMWADLRVLLRCVNPGKFRPARLAKRRGNSYLGTEQRRSQ
jgi:hypothetical protein